MRVVMHIGGSCFYDKRHKGVGETAPFCDKGGGGLILGPTCLTSFMWVKEYPSKNMSPPCFPLIDFLFKKNSVITNYEFL